MKAITLWQPWASAIALGYKHFETRSWSTKYRGKLAIHAAAKRLTKAEIDCFNSRLLEGTYIYKSDNVYYLSRNDKDHELILSKVIAIAELTECIPITNQFKDTLSAEELSYGDYSTPLFKGDQQRYAWKLEHIYTLEKPIHVKGQQGLWNIDLDFKNVI